MNLITIILIVAAIAGILWAYPRTPEPWNYAIVAVVILASLYVLLKAAGVPVSLN